MIDIFVIDWRRKIMRCLVVVLPMVALMHVACEGPQKVEFFDMVDLDPPQLMRVVAQSSMTIELCFDEPVEVVEQSLQVRAPMREEVLDIASRQATECGFALNLQAEMTPGEQYVVSAVVMDQSGNSLDVITSVYGYNGDVPQVIINEFTTRGSARHPDVVELYLKTGGNIGGVTLYEGSVGDWESRKVLPAVELAAGAYVLVHFKPQGIEAEMDETTSADASGGLDAHEEAWDFWVEEGNGLSGNNGALVLTATPQGTPLDAVIYTNRTSESDTKYYGFGSAKALARAIEIYETGQWRIENEEAGEGADEDEGEDEGEDGEGEGEDDAPAIRPEDVVFIDKSTATRSICRSSDSADTDRNEDWHIVPTSTYSFGEQNSDEVHGE